MFFGYGIIQVMDHCISVCVFARSGWSAILAFLTPRILFLFYILVSKFVFKSNEWWWCLPTLRKERESETERWVRWYIHVRSLYVTACTINSIYPTTVTTTAAIANCWPFLFIRVPPKVNFRQLLERDFQQPSFCHQPQHQSTEYVSYSKRL